MELLAVLFEDVWVIVGLDIARWIPRISHRVGEMGWRKGTDVDLGGAHTDLDAGGEAAVDEHAGRVLGGLHVKIEAVSNGQASRGSRLDETHSEAKTTTI
jgi:hypothetical protein